MSDTRKRLEQLRNRSTKYELVMRHDETGRRLRLCYTTRNNRHGIVDAIMTGGADLVRVAGVDSFTLGKGPSARIGKWTITFSGRTQREAIASDSELPWFKTALKET